MNGKWLSIVALVAVAGLLFGVNQLRAQSGVGGDSSPTCISDFRGRDYSSDRQRWRANTAQGAGVPTFIRR